MANDSLSVRNGSRSDFASSALDVGQLTGKNQSVKGASALDGLFGTSSEASFSQVLDSQVKREPSVASRPAERADASRSDKSGRNSGNDSPQQRLDAHQKEKRANETRAQKTAAREDAAPDKAARDRAATTDRRNPSAERSEAASPVKEHPTKSTRKNEQSKDAEPVATESNGPSTAPATAAVVPDDNATPTAAPVENADVLAEAAAVLQAQGESVPEDVLALAQQQLAMLRMPGGAMAEGGAEATTEGAMQLQQQGMLAAARNNHAALVGTDAGLVGSDAGLVGNTGVDGNIDGASGASGGLALTGMESVSGMAEVDPALKDLISAMMNARQAASSVAAGEQTAITATSVAGEQNVAANRLANATLTAATEDGLAATESASAAIDGLEESFVQMASDNEPAMSEESVDTPLSVSDAETLATGDLAADDELLTAQDADAGESVLDDPDANAAGAEDATSPNRARQERAVPAMTPSATDKSATDKSAPAQAEGWSILDNVADVLPKHLQKETPEALKNVTPPMHSDQQMAAVRDELRSLQRLMESGVQSAPRSLRESAQDDKGLDVKAGNLSRSIENLTGTVKNVELRSAVPASNTPVAFGRAGFAEQMAEKIMLMTTQKVQSAEIRLDPKELGAIDVKIRIHQDQATVVFSSPHAQVRDALENSIPRLREMFAESGLGLGNVNVNDRGGSSAGGNEQSQGQGGNGTYGGGEEIVEERQQRLPRQPNGLVDFYA